jgi:hypothetical protein
MALGNTRENGVRTLVITRVARSAAITKRRLHVRQYGPNYLKDNKSGGRGDRVFPFQAFPSISTDNTKAPAAQAYLLLDASEPFRYVPSTICK